MRVRHCGSRAALVELDRLDDVLGLHAALRARPPAGVTELVPAARTLLVEFDPAVTGFDRLAAELSGREPSHERPDAGAEVVVEVRYDGADLAEAAKLAGMSERELIEAHTAARYTVAFCGFSPGFGYLTGLPDELHLPRRADPRTRVPAGAVGLAGDYTGVYPRESPGGWQLIGRTELRIWDLDRDPPALLRPGTPVRFVEVGR
ncbi:MAG TPA: 5-oxoprolinase subunit PxpB [Pseudonocardiaceae bacterium]|jgi:KipI family sensor histidine kinase inhibitor|nr:5-oxoprolinase subunit PxpB [Pseudonocardiaceae bacterium]